MVSGGDEDEDTVEASEVDEQGSDTYDEEGVVSGVEDENIELGIVEVEDGVLLVIEAM